MNKLLKHKAFLLAGLALIAATLAVGSVPFSAAAGKDPAAENWNRLKIVTCNSGLTGFFDPETGKLYIYDANVEKCFMERQLVKLGEPLEKLKN